MHTAEIILHVETKEIAEIIHECLRPELTKKIPQTTIQVTLSNNKLTIIILAKTTPILRAAINSYSRWIQTALKVQQM